MAHADSHEAVKASTTPPPANPDEAVDIYVWKPGRPADAKAPKDKDPWPDFNAPLPAVRVSHNTPWSRTWRIFAAGLIMGVAATKAAELLLHPGRKSAKVKTATVTPVTD